MLVGLLQPSEKQAAKMFPKILFYSCVTIVCALESVGHADVRIKDITTVEGIRVNQLVGIGLVTGLDGTGGTSPLTRQYAQNFQQRQIL